MHCTDGGSYDCLGTRHAAQTTTHKSNNDNTLVSVDCLSGEHCRLSTQHFAKPESEDSFLLRLQASQQELAKILS